MLEEKERPTRPGTAREYPVLQAVKGTVRKSGFNLSKILTISEEMSLNPYTPKIVLSQYSTKFPNFIFFKCWRIKIAQCEGTQKEVPYGRSHRKISFADSNVRIPTRLHQSRVERLIKHTLSKYGNIFIAADSSVGYKRFTRYNTRTYITRTNISGKMERHKEKTNESLQKHEEVVATGEGILKRW